LNAGNYYIHVERFGEDEKSFVYGDYQLMKKLFLSLSIFAVLALIAIPATSFAAEESNTTVSGSGGLWAYGTGSAYLNGNGAVFATGMGLLKITDNAGDAVVVVNGMHRSISKGETVAYAGFNGHAYISGSNITISLAGRDVRMAASGDGTVTLKGYGNYNVNGTQGFWTADGVQVTF
jgi:hypothetical protein